MIDYLKNKYLHQVLASAVFLDKILIKSAQISLKQVFKCLFDYYLLGSAFAISPIVPSILKAKKKKQTINGEIK